MKHIVNITIQLLKSIFQSSTHLYVIPNFCLFVCLFVFPCKTQLDILEDLLYFYIFFLFVIIVFNTFFVSIL